MDKCNLTSCLKIISHLRTGQDRRCLNWYIFRPMHSAHSSAHSLALPRQSYPPRRLQLPPNAKDVTLAALVQARYLNSASSKLRSSARPQTFLFFCIFFHPGILYSLYPGKLISFHLRIYSSALSPVIY